MNDMSRHQDLSPQAAAGSDLDAFWKGSYELVKKELRGRYPKHEWR